MERSREELDTRLKRQIQFIVEVDKVKNIFRQTYPCGCKTEKRMTNNIPGIWRLWQYF